jgi:vesicle coat complex subunit
LILFRFVLQRLWSVVALLNILLKKKSVKHKINSFTKKFFLDLGLKVHLLPEKLLHSIESLLNDSQERIRTAAAIALVTLHRFSPQVLFKSNKIS